MPQPNPLKRQFNRHEGRKVNKWVHYLDIYDRHLRHLRGQEITLVEFGVNQGGSLQLWQKYFGPQVRIIGVDIDERCRQFEGDGVEIMIGDQENRSFLRSVVEQAGTIDVVIEDGGHRMGQQIATFEEVYPTMATDGIFLIEDLHTSYWPHYDGGLEREGTFIEYAKRLSDQLNAWHSRQPDFVVDDITRTTRSMHFYDSVIVFERGTVEEPRRRQRGEEVFDILDGRPERFARARAERATD